MLKKIKFALLPLLSGLGIAFIIVLATPSLRDALLPILSADGFTGSHMSYAKAVRRAAPAVVTVYSERISTQPRYMQRQNTVSELGSGVLMSPDGYILTNYHVINNADLVEVILADGRRFSEVQLVGFDTVTDLALLKVAGENLPAIPVDNDFKPQVGDVVLAIGNPLNLGQTITQGIISATGKQRVTDSSHSSLLQMDAAINVGNSGGALVNSHGDLVGITSAQFKTRANLDIQGIFFAVPYSLAKDVMDKLIRYGRVVRGYMGMDVTAVDQQGREVTNNHMAIAGMRINKMDPLGPAWRAGIKEGDIVVSMGGYSVSNIQQTLERIANTEPGTELEVELYRDGEPHTLTVTVAELETRL
ncbi:trypsin-like peptidase domain-containing protein [Pseudoalteromonas sp. Cnat2-41]|uniref:trypsin-like peptidase domain-containing protein n=1 Tax=unclassified Pseudoalteromonas TaxID=194690 RepID=UPI001EF76B40|nr:trypsin-like peptidase domain-containing protein [Pseudoalteromonas sp. CNAT2-18]MCF2862611.1 trypsin-like peptidase domain-containing protein [Pseudoalteromonas sp. CNAT2-18]MCG7558937.1 trypsin-like peptidase domain-containing protein [Pseudoalteromonas sp. CNAT2-18.1]